MRKKHLTLTWVLTIISFYLLSKKGLKKKTTFFFRGGFNTALNTTIFQRLGEAEEHFKVASEGTQNINHLST